MPAEMDHPYLPDRSGHNCLVCELRDDALHLCRPEAHPAPDQQHEQFVRQAVNVLSRYQDDGKAVGMTPEEKVTAVMRTTYALEATGGLDLSEDNAGVVAATIVASFDSRSERGDHA
jgi:hypothetical protein